MRKLNNLISELFDQSQYVPPSFNQSRWPFRAYIEFYLKQHLELAIQKIDYSSLQPTSEGLPIEIYAFTKPRSEGI